MLGKPFQTLRDSVTHSGNAAPPKKGKVTAVRHKVERTNGRVSVRLIQELEHSRDGKLATKTGEKLVTIDFT